METWSTARTAPAAQPEQPQVLDPSPVTHHVPSRAQSQELPAGFRCAQLRFKAASSCCAVTPAAALPGSHHIRQLSSTSTASNHSIRHRIPLTCRATRAQLQAAASHCPPHLSHAGKQARALLTLTEEQIPAPRHLHQGLGL